MKIDKTLPFYTEQDRIELAKYNRELDQLQADLLEERRGFTPEMEAAQEAGNMELVKELIEQDTALWIDRFEKLLQEQNQRLISIEQRYIESFKGDVSAILADVREIVDAVEKEEYITEQKQRAESFKPLLEKRPGKTSSKEEKERYRATKRLATKGYITCYYFILERIRVQLNALAFYKSEDGEAQAIAIAEDKTARFYNKPHGAKVERKPIERSLPIIKGAEVRGDLLTLPTSPIVTALYDILSGGDIDQLSDRKQKYNRNIQYLVEGRGDQRRISYTKSDGKRNTTTTVSVEIDDFRKIVNRNPQTKKILNRILIRANEQAIHYGVLTRDKVSFPLRELVGEGQYKNLETARQGFYNVADTLTGLKVSGKIERGKKKTLQQGVHAVLFKAAKVDNATCEIYLNEMLNWGLITPYYTGLPDFYFELPDRAAELLEYIFYIARQNTRQLAEQGYFTIGYRAIQYRLNLPDEKTCRNPRRDIKDAIEAAIEQIEEKYCKYAPPIPTDATGEDANPDFALLPLADYDAPIKKYLDEGKLKISLKGEYGRRFIQISQKTADRIEAARKRKEKQEDMAIARNLAKAKEPKNK